MKTKHFEPEMILIPAGEFLMGSDPQKDQDAYNDEQPQHTVYLPDYSMAKTPVTNVQYAAFVERTNHSQPEHWEAGKPPRGKEDHPVVHVSWHDAVAYCNWLAETTGKPYRLPTEAEWEKGARGTDGRICPWGDEWDAERCNTVEGGSGDTTPVGAYPEGASPYGVQDMCGNVWEWTADWYNEKQGIREVRGGSWHGYGRFARCAYRGRFFPVPFLFNLGFRVVVSLASSESCPADPERLRLLEAVAEAMRSVLDVYDPPGFAVVDGYEEQLWKAVEAGDNALSDLDKMEIGR